ncbi:MAG: hypothetical protein ACI835_005410, partial [Planctomycetota bacterium]
VGAKVDKEAWLGRLVVAAVRAWTERGYEHRQRVSKGGRYDLVLRRPAT